MADELCLYSWSTSSTPTRALFFLEIIDYVVLMIVRADLAVTALPASVNWHVVDWNYPISLAMESKCLNT
jgi:hypothetical protein